MLHTEVQSQKHEEYLKQTENIRQHRLTQKEVMMKEKERERALKLLGTVYIIYKYINIYIYILYIYIYI